MQNKLKISRLRAVVAGLRNKGFYVQYFCSGKYQRFIHLIPFCALVSGIFFFVIIPKSMVFQEIQSGLSKPASKWVIPTGRYAFCSIVIIFTSSISSK
jgi:NSS family neurotransmitter:Na+ symporter